MSLKKIQIQLFNIVCGIKNIIVQKPYLTNYEKKEESTNTGVWWTFSFSILKKVTLFI